MFPLGFQDKKMPITEELLADWLGYGAFQGLGQFRSGSYGQFVATIEKEEKDYQMSELVKIRLAALEENDTVAK